MPWAATSAGAGPTRASSLHARRPPTRSRRCPVADVPKTKIEVGLAGKTTVMEVEIPAGDPLPYKVGERPITGKRRPRLDGSQKVTGRAVYTHDAQRPGMLRALKVTYDVLPHTVSLAAARKDGAPLVFQKPVEEKHSAGDVPGGAAPVEQKGNVRGPKASGRGDVDKGFAESDGTLEVVTTTTVQTHVPLETHSLFAEWVGDTLEVQASTQGTFS